MTPKTSRSKHISPLALPREGERYRDIYTTLEEGVVVQVSASLINAKYGVAGAIRIRDAEYSNIDTHLPLYTHFNLEFCGHRIGAIYGLPRILTQGYFKSPLDEEPPILSWEDLLIGECIRVKEHIPYSAILDSDFEYSMTSIRSVESLKDTILNRYSVSMPMLSKDEILSRGVSVTTLRIL